MGSENSTTKNLTVATLNYSGILLSPFEFFSKESKEMTLIENSLSDTFQKLLKERFPDYDKKTFKWDLGKIDQKMQRERYSPLYHPEVGVVDKTLMDENQFNEQWLKVFAANVKEVKNLEFKDDERDRAREFDLMCYKCIVIHCYRLSKFEDFFKKKYDTKEYSKFMNLMFSKSFLNEKKKLEKTLNALQKEQIDVMFAQEADSVLIKQIEENHKKEFFVFKSEKAESIIIVRREKFQRFHSSQEITNPVHYISAELRESLNWNKDTMVAFVDNFIFISGHLSSKKDKNPDQVVQMIKSLDELHRLYPMCDILVGCDANSFAPGTYKEKANSNLSPYMYIYPDIPKLYTTSKERTFMQPQVNKAAEVAQVCRDHLILISNKEYKVGPFCETKVCTIKNEKPSMVPNLPSQNHPYDHYVVKGEITFNM